MRKMVFIVFTLSLLISACKTSKQAKSNQSLYQPPVEQVVAEEEVPVVVKTEEVTLANEENIGEKMFDFYVIIGSFKLQENANILQSQQVAKGNSSVVLKSETGMFRVAASGTNSESEARNLIQEIRVYSPEYSDVWLLKKK